MTNRRNFVKTVSFASIGLRSLAFANSADRTFDFSKLFHQEFLDANLDSAEYFAPGKPVPPELKRSQRSQNKDVGRYKTYYVNNFRYVDHDYILIPKFNKNAKTPHELQKKISDSCVQCILAAATDRNMIVYDASSKSGKFTPELSNLIKGAMGNNDVEIFTKNTIDSKQFSSLQKYYLEDLQGFLPEGCKNLVFAVAKTPKHMVMPIFGKPGYFKNDLYNIDLGIALLSNKDVMIASY